MRHHIDWLIVYFSVKPQLKKVSKYDNKFKSKVQTEGSAAKADFRSNLKVVKKENAIDDLLKVITQQWDKHEIP